MKRLGVLSLSYTVLYRSANRYDDVAILEANLRDLQIEHKRMQSRPS